MKSFLQFIYLGDGELVEYEISSKALDWSIGDLDEFIYIIWWLGFGYSYYKVMYYVYLKVSEADFNTLFNEIKKDKDIL